jgi:hypothetical protein
VKRAAVLALAGALFVLCAWTLTVRVNRQGNWSALYCHGASFPVPPAMAAEGLFLFSGFGYDGQLYHIIAHDPFFRRGFSGYVDDPRLRYRRGLVPVAAHLLALGSDRWVHVTYPALVLFFGALGVFWLSLLAQALGRSPLWGIGFLLLPAAFASFDRMTIDVALLAVVVGLLWALETRKERWVWVLLTLAPLVRDTGVLVVAGVVLSRWGSEGWTRAARLLVVLLPWLAWVAFVHAHTTALHFDRSPPLSEMFAVLARPNAYETHAPFTARIHQAADVVALLGLLWAFALTLWRAREWREPGQAVALAFVALGVLMQRREQFEHVYSFGRGYSPVLAVLLRDGLARRRPLGLSLSPTLALLPRMATQVASQVAGILSALF